MNTQVVHAAERSRFEVETEAGTAVLTYERRGGGRVALTHTVVPPEAEGRGVAADLAEAAVRWAEGEGLEVVPVCSYVQAWMDKNRTGGQR